jgi:hypothetical protein
MKLHQKTFSRAELTVETGIFNEAELAKKAALLTSHECGFEVRDFRYTLKGDVLQIVVYSSPRPARLG